MFKRFEMHASTLNEGLTNHATHTHRAEEFVVMLRGECELIGDARRRGYGGRHHLPGVERSTLARQHGQGRRRILRNPGTMRLYRTAHGAVVEHGTRSFGGRRVGRR